MLSFVKDFVAYLCSSGPKPTITDAIVNAFTATVLAIIGANLGPFMLRGKASIGNTSDEVVKDLVALAMVPIGGWLCGFVKLNTKKD